MQGRRLACAQVSDTHGSEQICLLEVATDLFGFYYVVPGSLLANFNEEPALVRTYQ